MRNLSGRRILGWATLAGLAFALAACGGRVSKDLVEQAGNIPSSFDVTLIADKDNQFDYDPEGGTNGAPLTEEDLKSALRYRKEQNLPCTTILIKRGEKVKRGQEIAQSGMSGDAAAPKLHFEVRKNSAPVDPRTFLE